ncbi:MAG TPA: hypothetical protein GXZ36_07520 [Firmicutes bacterium]|nr:hypothetical protein [Bacillota bacterium]
MMREWLFIFVVLLIFIDIYLSASVYVDAKKIKNPALGVPPQVWGLISFVFPLMGFLVYWLMHHSTLAGTNRN